MEIQQNNNNWTNFLENYERNISTCNYSYLHIKKYIYIYIYIYTHTVWLKSNSLLWVFSFLYDTIHAKRYLSSWCKMKSGQLPVLERIMKALIFTQNGTPSYFAIVVHEWLNAHFHWRWIGHHGQHEWLTRSPDLTPWNKVNFWMEYSWFEFRVFFSGCLTGTKELNLPYHLSIAEERTDKFVAFL